MSSLARLLAFLLPLVLAAQTYTVQKLGGGGLPVNLPATTVDIGGGYVATSPSGDVYLSLPSYNIVVRLSASGSLELVAGNGLIGYFGDGGPATSAQIEAGPIAFDPSGNLYLVGGAHIRKISNGIITAIAGINEQGYSGDGGPAIQAEISSVSAIATDSLGNLYLADTASGPGFPLLTSQPRIRKISDGTITTIAGNGMQGSSGDGGPATSAMLDYITGLAVDSLGDIFFSDSSQIREVSGGIISTYAGTAQPNASNEPNGDGGPVGKASFSALGSLTFDSHDNLFVADGTTVREVSGGIIRTVAGSNTTFSLGDGGPAVDAELSPGLQTAVDPVGDLFLFDGSDRLREVSAGIINTVAGNGGAWTQEGVAAQSAQLRGLASIAVDASGNAYTLAVFYDRILSIAGGVVSTFAGNGQCQYATPTSLSSPFVCGSAITFDSAGNLYLLGDTVIYEISNGKVSVVPGSQQTGYFLTGFAVDNAGNIYIADTGNQAIRKLSNGILSTVAGLPEAVSLGIGVTAPLAGFSGDGGLATEAQLHYPNQLVIDSRGTIYFTDSQNNRVRAITNGEITTVAGNGSTLYSGDGGPAVDAGLAFPEGLAVDGSGNLFIGDTHGFVRKVSGGIITTIAGSPMNPVIGSAFALDASGDLYGTDSNQNQIFKLIPSGPSCSYSVQQPTTTEPVSGGSVNVSVEAGSGCDWVVSNLPSWMSSSGSASGALLTFTSNAGAARSATILVAGELLVLAQDGVPMAISNGGVVNAASFSPVVAPGSIAAVFGSFPIDQPAQAAAFPIPNSLQGASIRFNSLSGALFYAGPSQINVQVPENLVNYPSYSAAVATAYGTSAAVNVNVAEFAPGIFAINGQGTGQGAILNLSNQLVDATHPAQAGDYIQIYCTGLGEVSNYPGTGIPAFTDPLSVTQTMPTVSIGGVNATVQFSGLAPGTAGLNQINVQVPAGVAPGTTVPVVVSIGGAVSNSVTLALQ